MPDWITGLNSEVQLVIAGFAGFGLFSAYAGVVMLCRKIRGKPVRGLPPEES